MFCPPLCPALKPNILMTIGIMTEILHGSEVFIGKASKGEVVGVLLRTLGNAAYGSLRLARRVKFDD